MTEWKPGDVAVVKRGPSWTGRAMFTFLGWVDQSGDFDDKEPLFDITDHRPLVVIDPENREQVERLAYLLHNFDAHLSDDPHRESAWASLARDALREFANPTPPKPEEPTNWLAVVEETGANRLWYRDGRGDNDEHPWRQVRDDGVHARNNWDEIPAVRVLSEGVPND